MLKHPIPTSLNHKANFGGSFQYRSLQRWRQQEWTKRSTVWPDYTIKADCSTAMSGFVFKVLIQAPFSIGTVLVLIYQGIRKNLDDTQPYPLFILSVSRLWKMHCFRNTHSFRHTVSAVWAAPQTVQESLQSCAEYSKPVIILWF